jgi:hypothetical protein
VSAEFKVENITDPYVDNAKETLISPLKFALIEDLNSDNGGVVWDGARGNIVHE